MAFVVPMLEALGGGSALAGAALATSVVATGITAYSSIQQGEYAAKVANEEARAKDFMARDALQRGVLAEEQQSLQIRRTLGTQLARYGASGVDISSGSPLMVMADTAGLGEMDILMARNNAAREAWGLKEEGKILRSQGAMARKSGYMQAAASLLTGASDSFGIWKSRKGK